MMNDIAARNGLKDMSMNFNTEGDDLDFTIDKESINNPLF